MGDVFKKALAIISLMLVVLVIIQSASAHEDISRELSIASSNADVLGEIDSNDSIENNESDVANDTDNESFNMSASQGNDTFSDDGLNDSEENESHPHYVADKGTYCSTAVKFSPSTYQYTTSEITYCVRAYDIMEYGGVDYIQPKYMTLVKLVVRTGKSSEAYFARIGDDGAAAIRIPNLALGTHKVKIYVAGEYCGSSYITIIKSTARVYAPFAIVKYKKNTYYNIKVTDNSYRPVNGIKLNVMVSTGSKSTTYSLTTNYKGIAKLKTKKLTLGVHKIVITANDKNYDVMKKSKISVEKSVPIEPAKLTAYAPAKTLKYGDNAYFAINVQDNYGNPSKKIKLNVQVFTGSKSKTYTVKTNSWGVANLNTKSLSLGSHKLIISSANAHYKVWKVSKIFINKDVESNTIKPAGLVSVQVHPTDDGDVYAKLKWNAKKNVKYQILRKSNDTFGVIATVTATSESMSFYDWIDGDTLFTYSVREIIEKGKNERILGPYDVGGLKLLASTNVTVDFQNIKAKIQWDDVEGATKYSIFRKVGRDAQFKEIASVDGDCLSYVDYYHNSFSEFAGIMYSKTFVDPSLNSIFYTVKACNIQTSNGIAKSSYGLYPIDGDFHLEAPAIVSLENGSLKWGGVPNAQGYLILKDKYGNGSWEVVANVSKEGDNVQSFDIGEVDRNAYYSVQAYAYKNGVKVFSDYDLGFSLMNRSEENSQYRILYIGDSITYGSQYTSKSTRHIFSIPYRVAQLLGCVYYNPSIPGSTYHDMAQMNGEDYARSITRDLVDPIAQGKLPAKCWSLGTDKNSEGVNNTSIDDYNIVVLAAGTNDYSYNAELGKANSTDVSTFNGALNHILQKIENASEKRVLRGETPIKVVFVDLYYSQHASGTNEIRDRDTTPNGIGLTLKDYQNALDCQCEKWSSSEHISVYNFKTRDYDIVNQSNCPYTSSDNIHFTKFTYGQYGNAFSGFLMQNVFD